MVLDAHAIFPVAAKHHASWEPVRDVNGEGEGHLAGAGRPIHEIEERVDLLHDFDVVLVCGNLCAPVFARSSACLYLEEHIFGTIESDG